MHDSFLAAIAAAPADRTPRLVYADWLDEQADPRGELIRVEEELRRVPVYSDRYWELKPRRNELRSTAGADWLRRMRYGTTYEPVFAGGVPDDVAGRWRLLREFVERWHGIPLPDAGGHAGEVARIERELGRTLPPAVREWVAFYKDLDAADRGGDVFRDCPGVERLPDLGVVSLMIQGESDYHWAVRADHLDHPDPPVEGYVLDYEGDGERFVFDRPVSRSVTGFALRYFRTYLNGSEVGAADPDRLAAGFPAHARFDEHMLFEAENLIAFHGPRYYLTDPPALTACSRGSPRPGSIPAALRDLGYNPKTASWFAATNFLSLTPATPDEYAFTHDLTRGNMEPYVTRFWGGWDPDVYRANYDRTENLILRYGDDRVGFVRLFPDGDRLVLEDLQILPAHQNRGLGTAALAEVERLAAEWGYRAVRLRCFHVNPAHRLYRRAGYEVVEPGETADWMEKPVPA